MESAAFSMKKRSSSSSSSSSSLFLTTVIPVALLVLLSAFLFSTSSYSPLSVAPPPVTVRPPPPPPPHPFINSTCANTPYPSVCLDTLSSVLVHPHLDNHSRTRNLLRISLLKTINRVAKSRFNLIAALSWVVQEDNWVHNCQSLLDLTQFELQESMKKLSSRNMDPSQYAVIKNILSAAMTNEESCIKGFSDLKLDDVTHTRLSRYFQKSLTPIIRMISNCLSITNYLETIDSRGSFHTCHLFKGNCRDHVPRWMTVADRSSCSSKKR